MTAAADLGPWLDASRAWADDVLRRVVPPADTPPRELSEALHYALFGGGKRLRPALARLVAHDLGAGDAAVQRPAAALELVHTYSLVHDDLPCMDDDDLRRGRPTVHVAYGEATAVLVGDALLTLAFEVLAGEPPRTAGPMASVLAQAAGARGMVGGQVLDLALAQDVGLEELLDMHGRKTAALFGAAAELGALAAEADPDRRGAARDFGRALGLCFQATDDLLDVTGDASALGKTPGKDAALERATLVTLLGLEGARTQAQALGEAARGAATALGAPAGGLAQGLVDFVLARTT